MFIYVFLNCCVFTILFNGFFNVLKKFISTLNINTVYIHHTYICKQTYKETCIYMWRVLICIEYVYNYIYVGFSDIKCNGIVRKGDSSFQKSSLITHRHRIHQPLVFANPPCHRCQQPILHLVTDQINHPVHRHVSNQLAFGHDCF